MKKEKNRLTLTGCVYTNTLLLNDIIVGKILNLNRGISRDKKKDCSLLPLYCCSTNK